VNVEYFHTQYGKHYALSMKTPPLFLHTQRPTLRFIRAGDKWLLRQVGMAAKRFLTIMLLHTLGQSRLIRVPRGRWRRDIFSILLRALCKGISHFPNFYVPRPVIPLLIGARAGAGK
jgi:hypothetical protein